MAIGDTTFQETEAAVESEAAESEAAVEQKAAESEPAVESKAAESEPAAVETSGTSASPEEKGSDVFEETTMISKPETAAQESASAVQDKSAALENETTVPHFAGKLTIAVLLMAFAVAAVTVISRIRRKRANERRRAAREARLRAWNESQAAEEEMRTARIEFKPDQTACGPFQDYF